MGRAGVRAKVGLAEGFVGAALVEPIVYKAAQIEQADYTMMDSLVNVGIGSIMGAGLHAGIGAVSDKLSKGASMAEAKATAEPQGPIAKVMSEAPEEVRRSMLQAAIAQEARGEAVNVDALAGMSGVPLPF